MMKLKNNLKVSPLNILLSMKNMSDKKEIINNGSYRDLDKNFLFFNSLTNIC